MVFLTLHVTTAFDGCSNMKEEIEPTPMKE